MVTKPFAVANLTQRLREMLDQGSASRG
jgi:DNA-binding response OmpR family regulator